ncbi:MAG: helix-turn-helix transcriptional regulator [Eggerthellaceae bacterium]|nr:helix-turn-helix transcriptional regulator [Eggerthellaceae bacterium]
MRAFVIADASKRKAKPVGVLFWDASCEGGQGRFFLELSSCCREANLPLSLSFCAYREGRRATPEESEEWVKSRIVPEDRHNIVEVLRANGLSEYDEVSLLAASNGRSSDDDFLAYEVTMTDELARELESDCQEQASQGKSGKNDPSPMSRADKLLAVVERRRNGVEVRYACVDLPKDDTSNALRASEAKGRVHSCDKAGPCPHGQCNAARRIGAQIREQRQQAGLTQKQLAARAGITQAVLSRVESGSGNPTLALLEELAFALDSRLDVSLASDQGSTACS